MTEKDSLVARLTVTDEPHRQRFKSGVRAAIAWLHHRAKFDMNDPHAKAILNTAAYHLGNALACNEVKPTAGEPPQPVAAPLEAGAVRFYDEHNCPVCHSPQPALAGGVLDDKGRLLRYNKARRSIDVIAPQPVADAGDVAGLVEERGPVVPASLSLEDAVALAAQAEQIAARRAEAAESRLARLEQEAVKVVTPFADIAGEAWADETGWTDAACQNDRICDWFGPSDFLAARAFLDKHRRPS